MPNSSDSHSTILVALLANVLAARCPVSRPVSKASASRGKLATPTYGPRKLLSPPMVVRPLLVLLRRISFQSWKTQELVTSRLRSADERIRRPPPPLLGSASIAYAFSIPMLFGHYSDRQDPLATEAYAACVSNLLRQKRLWKRVQRINDVKDGPPFSQMLLRMRTFQKVLDEM